MECEPWPWVLGGPLDLQAWEVFGWTGAAGGTWASHQKEVSFLCQNCPWNALLEADLIWLSIADLDKKICIFCFFHGSTEQNFEWEKYFLFADCSHLELEGESALEKSWPRTDSSWSSRHSCNLSKSSPLWVRWHPMRILGPSSLLWRCSQVILRLWLSPEKWETTDYFEKSFRWMA